MTYFYPTTEGHFLLPPTTSPTPSRNPGLDTVLSRWSVNTRPLTRQSQRVGGWRRGCTVVLLSMWLPSLSTVFQIGLLLIHRVHKVGDRSVETVDSTFRGAIRTEINR